MHEVWAPGKIESTNIYKWSNFCYPANSNSIIKTPLSCQVEAQPPPKNKTACFDTAATSNCGRQGDHLIPTSEPSGKVFTLPDGTLTPASTKSKLHHNVREPARTVDMVPALKSNTLLSGPKFADTDYITVLVPTEVLIYDSNKLTLQASKDTILRGWRDEATGL